MKRSHDFHEKIRLNLNRKLHLPPEQSASERGSGEIGKEGSAVPSPSKDPRVVHFEEENLTAKPLTESSPSIATELFRTRLAARLKSTLDGLVSELQNPTKSGQSDLEILHNKATDNSFKSNDEDATAELVLQNFIHSAKSQISGLLSKRQKVSNENSRRITKSFKVDPLQIQISLKLQDLLCNALDNQRCESNAVDNNNLVDEAELRNLSHLLQDFLSSAKKKLSFSLNPDSEKQPYSESSRIVESALELSQLPHKASVSENSRLPLHKTSLPLKTPDKQEVGDLNVNEQNKRQLRLRRGNKSVTNHSQLVINTKNSNIRGPNKQSIGIKGRKVVPKSIQKSGRIVESISSQINKNQRKRPSTPNKSCQINFFVNKKSTSENLLDKKIIPENRKNNAAESNELLIVQPQSNNQNKSSQVKELDNCNSIPSQKSSTYGTNFSRKLVNLPQEEMETSQYAVHDNPNYMNGGILLLSECERTPDFLDLNLEVQDSDADDPDPVYDSADFIRSGYQDLDSDEDVVVLGEKRPTYQEITLDEDDDGEVCEKVIELERPTKIPKSLQDLLYDCPNCDKKFRVESLLKFHVRMHSVVESTLGRVPSPTQPEIIEEIQADEKAKKSKSSQRHRRKEKENNKQNSKTSRKHKTHREMYAKRKSKMAP